MDLPEENPDFVALSARPLAVLWTMSLTGEITEVSDSILQVRGITVEESKSQPMDQMLSQEAMRKTLGYFEEFSRAIIAGEAPGNFRAELDYLHKDGSLVPFDVMAIPVFGPDGTVTELRGVSAPIGL